MGATKRDFYAGDLFGEIHQAELGSSKGISALKPRAYLPGLLLCATAALAAAWLADHYQFPIILLGLLIGLSLSFVSEVEATAPGLDFASRHFLRLGIVLLGLQVTFVQVGMLGWVAFAGLVAVMVLSFLSALFTASIVGEGREAGILSGGATAICGASAALALYGVIGDKRLSQARFTVTLVGVAVASAIAMSLYPALAQAIDLSDRQAGFLIGASVHDAAQAIGGAFSYSDVAGADATVVKLARVAMLGPIVALVAVWLGRSAANSNEASWYKLALPWFVVGFFVVMALNSVVAIPGDWRGYALTLSKALLLLAVTATAMRSQMGLILEAGWRPLMPVAVASAVSFACALVVAVTVIP